MSAVKSDESDADSDSEDLDDNDSGSDEEDNDAAKSKQIVKMMFRKPVVPTTPISLLIESLVKQLASMLESSEDKALQLYNALCAKFFEMKLIDESYHMTEFEGVRGQYERALYQLVRAARAGADPLAWSGAWPGEPPGPEWSRYQREFDELEYIAGGGFGQVFRARHKLDASEYAVKKIIIRANDVASVSQCLDEVKTFASLSHCNIVPYKAAWLELGAPAASATIELLEDSALTSDAAASTDDDDDDSLARPAARRDDESSDFGVQFTSKQYSQSLSGALQRRRRQRHCSSRNSVSEGGQAVCKYEFGREARAPVPAPHQWATLYIQMALCQLTLKQWLDTRNAGEPRDAEGSASALVLAQRQVRRETVARILQQLLAGVQYMHSKHVVHHDIKPSNVFLQMDAGVWRVQLGDFGLACPLRGARHPLAHGTKLYAAPEQLAGKCDPKSDMYSLGIVLLELVDTFRTDMERVRCISDVRKGRIAAHLSAREPQLAHVIAQLVARNPNARPDAAQLLRTVAASVAPQPPPPPLPSDDSERVRHLEHMLAERDHEIAALRQSLQSAREKEQELDALKRKLKSAGVDV